MKIEGHTINQAILCDQSSVVIDIGGNRGSFSAKILELFNCHVECYEPDIHAYQFILSRIQHSKFSVYNKAVAGTAGRTLFYAAEPAGGGNSILEGNREFRMHAGTARTYEVESVTLASILQKHGNVDLIKMDCEGAELEIIRQTTEEDLRRARQITIEFHDFCFEHITTADTDECIAKLRAAGFYAVYWPDHTDPDRDYYFYQPVKQF